MKIQQLITYKFYIFLGVPFLLFFALQLLGFDGLYGQDSYEYLRYTKAIQNYFTTGEHPNAFYWPVLYPFIGSILGFIFGNVVFGLHFLSAISIGISCVYLYKTLEILYPKKTTTNFYYVFTFGLLSPYFLRAGLLVMSDMFAAMCIVLTTYQFIKSYIKKTSISYVFIFATCALMVRYATLVITFPMIIFSLYFVIKQRNWKAIIVGSIWSLIICIPFIILQWDNLVGGTSNYFLNAWSIENYFKTSHTSVDGTSTYLLPNILFVFSILVHPGFLFFGVFALYFILKRYNVLFTFSQKIITISIACYLLFLAGIPFQNIRVLTLIFPLVLLFFFLPFYEITQFKLIKKHTISIAILCILFQLALSGYGFNTVFKRTFFEKEIAISLQPYQGKKLYSFEYTPALKGRGLNFDFRSLYYEVHDDYKENDLIFFNPTKLAAQWNDKNPMKNWNHINTSFQLEVLESFEGGWNLYQIISKK
ncbi:glycosyltransferase family 39 protein [uncultured Kordia sp.]|uniref:ArnT family glycosyltransferase n=1 Tax=uncultured Kordia sp. TaxID=507699 RepID=UPI002617B8B3|nr:glycosyltransferase family 39 protein [uncultured Kordia sp.]